jgi:hypothetical protein
LLLVEQQTRRDNEFEDVFQRLNPKAESERKKERVNGMEHWEHQVMRTLSDGMILEILVGEESTSSKQYLRQVIKCLWALGTLN